MAIHILTDSTADIEPVIARASNIIMVPQHVTFGDTSYLDGIEIDNATFYQMLATSADLPTTSMPSVTELADGMRTAIRAGASGILAIMISSAFSGTYDATCMAAKTVTAESGIPIEVIDGRGVNVMLSMPILKAAERARAGASMSELTALVQRMIDHAQIFFLVDTLSYLQRGGRIGRAQALVGTMLNIKPILTIRDGVVTPIERVRSRHKALARIAELARAIPNVDTIGIASSDDRGVEDMRAIAESAFPGIPVTVSKIGANIGTHAGPGTAGIYFTSSN